MVDSDFATGGREADPAITYNVRSETTNAHQLFIHFG